MRIIHVLESLQMGGMERMVADLAKCQKARGHDVAVYTISRSGPLADDLKASGIETFDCEKKPGFDTSVITKLKDKFSEQHPDVIHTHNSLANIYAAPAGKWAGIKTVINTRHGSVDPRQKSLWLWRVSFLFTDKIVFVCQRAKDEFDVLRMASRNKGIVIYNGINLKQWQDVPEGAREKVGEMLGIPAKSKIIGVICRLDLLKDIPTLVKAFALVAEKNKNVTLMIVGNGTQMDVIRKTVADLSLEGRVHLLGERTDVKVLLASMDMFVLPTLAEGLSIALLEAMAYARPIITTIVGGNPELVIHQLTGLLVNPGDPKEMANAIEDYLKYPALSYTLGDNARKRVLSYFETERMANDYQNLYEGKDVR